MTISAPEFFNRGPGNGRHRSLAEAAWRAWAPALAMTESLPDLTDY